MRNIFEMLDYCNQNRFLYDPQDSIIPLLLISRMLKKDEEAEVVWTSPFVAADILANKTLFDNEPVAFAITNKRIICADVDKNISIPLADFNGVFVSISHDYYGSDVVLAMKSRLLVFGWHDMYLRRLVHAITGAQDKLVPAAVDQYDEIYGADS